MNPESITEQLLNKNVLTAFLYNKFSMELSYDTDFLLLGVCTPKNWKQVFKQNFVHRCS